MTFKTRILLGLPLLALPLALFGCEGPEPPSTSVRVGDPCEDCSMCKPSIDPCDCRTCVNIAFDPEKSVVVSCSRATLTWIVTRECPGGGSVECADFGGYDVSCLDENGDDVPR